MGSLTCSGYLYHIRVTFNFPFPPRPLPTGQVSILFSFYDSVFLSFHFFSIWRPCCAGIQLRKRIFFHSLSKPNSEYPVIFAPPPPTFPPLSFLVLRSHFILLPSPPPPPRRAGMPFHLFPGIILLQMSNDCLVVAGDFSNSKPIRGKRGIIFFLFTVQNACTLKWISTYSTAPYTGYTANISRDCITGLRWATDGSHGWNMVRRWTSDSCFLLFKLKFSFSSEALQKGCPFVY